MRSLGIFVLLLCWGSWLGAQTFTVSPMAPIPANNETCLPNAVSGLPTAINSGFGLKRVCMNITHSWDGDLRIRLQAPDGTIVLLSQGVGGSGDNFLNTCFVPISPMGFINQGAPPFTGDWMPLNPMGTVNNGQNPNGNWNLCLLDEYPDLDTGSVHWWSIEFGANPAADSIVPGPQLPCGTGAPWACDCPDGSDTCDMLPDLTNAGLQVEESLIETAGQLSFATATPNIGWGSAEAVGTATCICGTDTIPCSDPCSPDSVRKQLVVQRIYQRHDSVMTYYDRPAGTMTHHPGHGHIHVDDWVKNTLRIMGPDPDPRTWPIIGTSTKVSFCLINLSNCDLHPGYCLDTLGNTLTSPNFANDGFGVESGCGTHQGIWVGELDIYSNGLNVPLDLDANMCNGRYFFVSYTDPNDNFLETNEDNNVSVTEVNLGQQGGGVCCTAHFYTVGNTMGMAPFTVQFADSSMPVPNDWLWDFGDGTFSTDQFPNHTYTTAGVYNVTLMTSNDLGCQAQEQQVAVVTVTADTTVGAAPATLPSALRLVPNPVSATSQLQFYLPMDGDVTVRALSLVGQQLGVLYTGNLNAGNQSLMMRPADLGLAQGVYLLQVETTGGMQHLRMVVR